MKSTVLEEFQQGKQLVKQATLQEVLESLPTSQWVEVVDLDAVPQSILGGSALDVFNAASLHMLSRPVYSMSYKKGNAWIKLGAA